MRPGDIIKEARQQAGISQHTLARRSGVAQSQICKYEKHESKITELSAQRIARVLNLPLKDILGDK